MANQTGIAIVIKAFLPTGKTLDEQFNALSIVREAHATGDYATLLKAATVEDVKTEQKTRRIEDQPQSNSEVQEKVETEDGIEGQEQAENDPDFAEVEGWSDVEEAPVAADADVPDFLKKDKKSKAA
ncbi:hypothetical protein SAMN05428953_12640 [Mesorhizobium muleiense]|uniref:Uncharacterized protein n=1 Tax=Mesorhizobium muleiense TaxID=1004279 RepID=A0A1G9H1N8_9HYPH|nr:hypothetical protein [Mesorhizobium muleiense]SDL06831.1 hypothetical protein SAMN05428953_12640 [Mesorhizobium muleiense]